MKVFMRLILIWSFYKSNFLLLEWCPLGMNIVDLPFFLTILIPLMVYYLASFQDLWYRFAPRRLSPFLEDARSIGLNPSSFASLGSLSLASLSLMGDTVMSGPLQSISTTAWNINTGVMFFQKMKVWTVQKIIQTLVVVKVHNKDL